MRQRGEPAAGPRHGAKKRDRPANGARRRSREADPATADGEFDVVAGRRRRRVAAGGGRPRTIVGLQAAWDERRRHQSELRPARARLHAAALPAPRRHLRPFPRPFGVAPALQASRAELVTELKEKGGQAASNSIGRRWFSLRNLLVVGQVALSLVALISAGLFLRSLGNAWRINPGFETEKVMVLSF